jgi:hypothetical protein
LSTTVRIQESASSPDVLRSTAAMSRPDMPKSRSAILMPSAYASTTVA